MNTNNELTLARPVRLLLPEMITMQIENIFIDH